MARRNLEEKMALVTGASRGIGRAITHRFLGNGIRVIALTRNPVTAEPLEGVQWLQCDLAQEGPLNALIDAGELRLEEIDILVNGAGFSDFGPVEKLPAGAAARHFQVMLDAPITLTQAILPHMLRKGRGAVVNVTSLAVELPIPYLPLYNAAKAGLAGFTRSLMLDLCESGIQVIDLRPGDFRTAFYASSQLAPNLGRRELKAWDSIREMVEKGSLPDKAAAELWRFLEGGQAGVLRTGSWFESRFASWAGRLLPDAFMRRRILRYYGL